MRLNRWNVGVTRHVITAEIVVDKKAVARVDHSVFMQRCAHAPNHRTGGLTGGGFHVQNSPCGEHADHAPQADFAGVAVDADLGEMRAVGLLRKLFSHRAGHDLAHRVHAGRTGERAQIRALSSAQNATAFKRRIGHIDAQFARQFFAQIGAGIKQSRARAGRAKRAARARCFREITVA